MAALLAPAALSPSLWLDVIFLNGESSVVWRWQKLFQSALAGEHVGMKLQPRLIFVCKTVLTEDEELLNPNS